MARADESKRPHRTADSGDGGGVADPPLSAGLWLVATPIGHADDITLRALTVFRRADVLACEDTRRTRKLLEIHGIPIAGRRMISYNDANGSARRPEIMRLLEEGRSVAYASDAGTPLIADPGYRLVEAAQAAGHSVQAVPGASAVLTALTLSGLPTNRFLFCGFLPVKQGARRREAKGLAEIDATLIFFESPRRLAASLADLAGILGASRQAAVIREATKMYEETVRGSLDELAQHYGAIAAPKGEAVLVVGPPAVSAAGPGADHLDELLHAALREGSVKDASKAVADATGLSRRDVYTRAVAISEMTGSGRGQADGD